MECTRRSRWIGATLGLNGAAYAFWKMYPIRSLFQTAALRTIGSFVAIKTAFLAVVGKSWLQNYLERRGFNYPAKTSM
jgi:hypothetical protein